MLHYSVTVETPIRLMVTAKAYPTPSVKYHEAVCVAGIRTDTTLPQWVRLYPVDFRELQPEQQFKKYDEIEIVAAPHSTDRRPESMRPQTSTLKIVRQIGTGHGWRDRWELVRPLLDSSMCDVLAQHDSSGKSLGAFRPGVIHDVLVQKESDDWSPTDLNKLSQMTMLAPDKQVLEKIPWRWLFAHTCPEGGTRHEQTIIDWEIGEAWRRWRRQYGAEDAVRRIREKWLNDLCGPKRDPVFFVGNQHGHPRGFLVLGVFWPPTASPDLNDLQERFDFTSHLDDDLPVTVGAEPFDTENRDPLGAAELDEPT
jgi:hypothetical protein